MLNKMEWLAKIKAAAIHLMVTVVSALVVWQLILFWYPGGFAGILNSLTAYKIVMAVELTLGPLMSLVIYSAIKSRRELVMDYMVVGLIQFGALCYGLYVVEAARPAYVIFARDRLEVVRPLDLEKANLAAVTNTNLLTSIFKSTSYLCVNFPGDNEGKKTLLTSVLHGTDIHRLPKYYRECEPGELYKSAKDFALLEGKKKIEPATKKEFEQLMAVHHSCAWHRLFIPSGEIASVVCSDENKIQQFIE